MSNRKDWAATYQPNDFIALEFARLASERLDDEHIRRFAADIHHLRERADNRYLQDWERLIVEGPERLRSFFLERSDLGQVMRSVCSFRAFVTPEERADIIAAHVPQRSGEHLR